MSATTDLLTGVAVKIAAEVTPTIVYTSLGVYTAGQTGIMMKVMPATPDRVVTLALVTQGDNITQPLGNWMLQVRGRGLPGQPLDVDDLMDSIFDVLHGTQNLVFGTVTVIQMNRQVSVPMGEDTAKRWERVDQYYLDVNLPGSTNRPTAGSW